MHNFEQLGKIGEGAFGSVSKARNCTTGEIVAIKKVRLRQDESGKVVREMMALQQLDHPNVRMDRQASRLLLHLLNSYVGYMQVIAVHDIFPHVGSLMFVCSHMETDLRRLLYASEAALDGPQIKSVMTQLLRGVAHCHVRGIMHRVS